MRWQERADVNRRSQRMEKSFQGLRSTGKVVIILVATMSLHVVETTGDTERSPSLTWAECLLRQSFFCKFFTIIWLWLNKTASSQRATFLKRRFLSLCHSSAFFLQSSLKRLDRNATIVYQKSEREAWWCDGLTSFERQTCFGFCVFFPNSTPASVTSPTRQHRPSLTSLIPSESNDDSFRRVAHQLSGTTVWFWLVQFCFFSSFTTYIWEQRVIHPKTVTTPGLCVFRNNLLVINTWTFFPSRPA